jgi:hypothetical protein
LKPRNLATMSGFEPSQFGGDSTKKFSVNKSDKNEVSTPTGRRAVNFFGTAEFKVKDDSQARTTTKRTKLEELVKKKIWREEIEHANQLANEAN